MFKCLMMIATFALALAGCKGKVDPADIGDDPVMNNLLLSAKALHAVQKMTFAERGEYHPTCSSWKPERGSAITFRVELAPDKKSFVVTVSHKASGKCLTINEADELTNDCEA
ncbi:hypothetical protein ACFL6C_11415 [Myxococcota bacterium]